MRYYLDKIESRSLRLDWTIKSLNQCCTKGGGIRSVAFADSSSSW